jgi:preprotein translocase SecF subunit
MKFAGEVTLDVVAALLVVLGYSVNDTIIIFDRIRENRKLNPSMPDYQLINLSISESLNRTVMTVSTVVIVLVVMLLVGGSGLFDFALVLLMGVLMGTYSSLYMASPLVYLMHERARKKGKTITYRNTEQEVQPMLRSK